MAAEHFDAVLSELPALISESDLHISQVTNLAESNKFCCHEVAFLKNI